MTLDDIKQQGFYKEVWTGQKLPDYDELPEKTRRELDEIDRRMAEFVETEMCHAGEDLDLWDEEAIAQSKEGNYEIIRESPSPEELFRRIQKLKDTQIDEDYISKATDLYDFSYDLGEGKDILY